MVDNEVYSWNYFIWRQMVEVFFVEKNKLIAIVQERMREKGEGENDRQPIVKTKIGKRFRTTTSVNIKLL